MTENRWNSSGIFSRLTTLQLLQEVQKFMNKMSESEQFQGRIIFMSTFNDTIWGVKDNEKEVLLIPHLCCTCKKISSRTLIILRTWIRIKVVLYLQRKTRRKMGRSRWIDDQIRRRKRTTQFSVPRVRCLEERSKAKEVENYLFTSVPMEIRLKLFAHLFLLISSVSTEQSQICVRSTVTVEQEQGDLLFQSNLTHTSRQQTYWHWHLHVRLRLLHKNIYCKCTKNE